MDEIHHANVQVTICSENHIHIRMTSNDDSDCPALDRMKALLITPNQFEKSK